MRAAFVPQGESIPLRKPRGGYQLIPVVHLALAWWAYHEKLIRLVDLRVWFAAWEMRSRRCRRPSPLPCRFGLDELRGLTGLSPKRLRESLRRLEAARLLTWSESTIGFPASPEVVPLPDRADFRRFLDAIPNHQRLAPVPRRILRLLAGGARPALIATILGHLVRCLYLKHGKCSARGRVKASWIADTFGVSLRRVKQARKELIAMGWLIPLEARQWALNRWGSHVCINLAWSRLDGIKPDIRLAATAPAAADGLPPAPAPGRELAPPPLPPGAESAPPDSNKEPLQGAEKPGTRRRRTGWFFHLPTGRADTGARANATGRRGADPPSSVAAAGGNLRDFGKSRTLGRPGAAIVLGSPGEVPAAGEARSPQRRPRGSQGHRPPAGAVRPGGRLWLGHGERVRPAAVRGGGRACSDYRYAEPVRSLRSASTGRTVAFRDARRRGGGQRAAQAAPSRGLPSAAGGARTGDPAGAGAVGRCPPGAGGARGGGPLGVSGRSLPTLEA